MSFTTPEKSLIRPESLQYIRIPGKCSTDHPHASLHREAYAFWKSFWEQTLKENKVKSIHIYADDFLRQEDISLVLYNKKIVGLVANTFYDLSFNSHLDTKYLNENLNEIMLQNLKKRNVKKLSIMEYLSVDQGWRMKNSELPLSSILIGLSVKLFTDKNVDACLGMPRKDRKVHEILKNYGAESIGGEFVKYNTPCEILCFYKEKTCPHKTNEVVNKYVEYLYKHLEDPAKKAV